MSRSVPESCNSSKGNPGGFIGVELYTILPFLYLSSGSTACLSNDVTENTHDLTVQKFPSCLFTCSVPASGISASYSHPMVLGRLVPLWCHHSNTWFIGFCSKRKHGWRPDGLDSAPGTSTHLPLARNQVVSNLRQRLDTLGAGYIGAACIHYMSLEHIPLMYHNCGRYFTLVGVVLKQLYNV